MANGRGRRSTTVAWPPRAAPPPTSTVTGASTSRALAPRRRISSGTRIKESRSGARARLINPNRLHAVFAGGSRSNSFATLTGDIMRLLSLNPCRLWTRSLIATAIAGAACTKAPAHTLAGDWDAYVALGSTARGGFEGWRRMGFAHFAGPDSSPPGWI